MQTYVEAFPILVSLSEQPQYLQTELVLHVAPSPFYSSQEKTNLKLYIQVFCVRPHTLGRLSLRQ